MLETPGEAHARRPARRGARDALRRAVAAAAGPRQGPPGRVLFPDFDQQLADAMRRETELFFNDLVREDRSVLDLFTADYTFVNERLARHYGIPDVVRRASSGRCSIPTTRAAACSATAASWCRRRSPNRTSPVLRGKWVMEVLIGTPPPPPPPGHPDLEETGRVEGRQDAHDARADGDAPREPDVQRRATSSWTRSASRSTTSTSTGKWRIRENGTPLDTRGDFTTARRSRRRRELRRRC